MNDDWLLAWNRARQQLAALADDEQPEPYIPWHDPLDARTYPCAWGGDCGCDGAGALTCPGRDVDRDPDDVRAELKAEQDEQARDELGTDDACTFSPDAEGCTKHAHPVGVSPVRHALVTLAQIGAAADERPEAFRPTGLQPDARIIAVPHVADPTAPTRAELAVGTPLDAFVDELALVSDVTPDAVLDALRPIMTGTATYRGQFVPDQPGPVTGLPVRILGRPYRAHPHPDGRPGYTLTPDRAARFRERITP